MSDAQSPMFQVENVESWRGQKVTDRDGESLGKLADVMYDNATGQPVLGVIKSGLLGHESVVPLAGATLSRDEFRLPHTKDLVHGAPRLPSDGLLRRQDEVALAQHYSVTVPESAEADESVRYESSSAIEQRRRAESDALARAEKLEAKADDRGKAAAQNESKAADETERAQAAEAERQRLLAEAAELRRAAGDPPT